MKVSDQNNSIEVMNAQIRQTLQQKRANVFQADTKNQQAAVDKVELSDQAKQVQHAAKAVNDSSEIREDLVRQTKMEVDNGTYKVVGAKVANGMLNESIENNIILQKINTKA